MRSGIRVNALALLGYVTVSSIYFGSHLLPHPERAILGSGRDAEIFVWSFAWWEHAIATGTNPLVSHAVYAPDGINLAWATTVPALSVVFAPVTAITGPVAAYNIAAILMPALAAWTAFLLCRYLTGALWPSLASGYLFGFSAYILGHELGHLDLTAVFLLPLMALTLTRSIRGEIGPRALALRAGLLIAGQAWISTEVAVTLTVVVVAALVLAFVLLPELRPRLRSLVRPLSAGYAIAAVLTAPLVGYAIAGFQSGSINEPARYDADLLNIVVPTHLLALTTSGLTAIAMRFGGNDAENTAYLGLPALAIVAWFGLNGRRSSSARFLLAAFGLAVLAELGTSLHVEGVRKVWLPWSLTTHVPVLDNVLPGRFAAYTALAIAVIVALWTAGRKGIVRAILPALAIAALVPVVWRPDYRLLPERWAFFTDGIYKICIVRNENLAIFPYGFNGDSMLWQAESGFWFRMAGGYLAPKPPKPFIDDPLVQKLTYTYESPTLSELRSFATRKRVARVLEPAIYQQPTGVVLRELAVPQFTGGMVVSPACGYPPLTPQS